MNVISSQASAEIHISPGIPEQKCTRTSMLYNALPTVVRSRLPALPSFRRSINDFRSRAIYSKNVGIAATATETTAPESPPPTYSSRRSSGEHSRVSIASADTEEINFQDDVPERPELSMYTPPPFPVSESMTGINWKYANQGISLLTQAHQESAILSSNFDETSIDLTRQLYLHGMAYVLRGLPFHLTPDETLSLHAAIPDKIANLSNDPSTHALIPRSYQQEVVYESPSQSPSVLHRITATIVFHIFVLFQFLLPYFKLIIGHAYRFERDHKVTQRIMNKSRTTIYEFGRRSLQLSQTICQMNEGRVGQAISDMTMWWVRGLTGGIQQGISDGVIVIGSEGPACLKGRRPGK